MPPSKTPGGIFVGLFTTNWAISQGIEAFAHAAEMQRHFSAPLVPAAPII